MSNSTVKFPIIVVGFSSTGLKKLGYKTCPFVWTKAEMIEQLVKIKTKQPKLNLGQYQDDKTNFVFYTLDTLENENGVTIDSYGLYEDKDGNQIQISPEGKAYRING